MDSSIANIDTNTAFPESKNIHIYRFSNKNCYNMYGYFVIIFFFIIFALLICYLRRFF